MITKPATYVALLRGINVGGNTPVAMSELKACFEAMGYANVSTYINSGNVIFRTNETDPRALEVAIEAQLQARFTHAIRVVVRSLNEIESLLAHVPSNWHGEQGKAQKCNVIFLRHTIDAADIVQQFSPKPEIETLQYVPGALLWSAQTSSLTKSTMIKTSSSPLYQDMTVRIYNTVQKIAAIMRRTDQEA